MLMSDLSSFLNNMPVNKNDDVLDIMNNNMFDSEINEIEISDNDEYEYQEMNIVLSDSIVSAIILEYFSTDRLQGVMKKPDSEHILAPNLLEKRFKCSIRIQSHIPTIAELIKLLLYDQKELENYVDICHDINIQEKKMYENCCYQYNDSKNKLNQLMEHKNRSKKVIEVIQKRKEYTEYYKNNKEKQKEIYDKSMQKSFDAMRRLRSIWVLKNLYELEMIVLQVYYNYILYLQHTFKQINKKAHTMTSKTIQSINMNNFDMDHNQLFKQRLFDMYEEYYRQEFLLSENKSHFFDFIPENCSIMNLPR